jgi:hypothetical protein
MFTNDELQQHEGRQRRGLRRRPIAGGETERQEWSEQLHQPTAIAQGDAFLDSVGYQGPSGALASKLTKAQRQSALIIVRPSTHITAAAVAPNHFERSPTTRYHTSFDTALRDELLPGKEGSTVRVRQRALKKPTSGANATRVPQPTPAIYESVAGRRSRPRTAGLDATASETNAFSAAER